VGEVVTGYWRGGEAELVVGRGGGQDAPEDADPVVTAEVFPLGLDCPDVGKLDEVYAGVDYVRFGLGRGPGM
jgi:hypothetical protein